MKAPNFPFGVFCDKLSVFVLLFPICFTGYNAARRASVPDVVHVGENDVRPYQRRKFPAHRARNVPFFLRAVLILHRNTGSLRVCRRAYANFFFVPEIRKPLSGKNQGVALIARRCRVCVDFVGQQYPNRTGTQPRWAVRSHHRDMTAGKYLVQDRVPAIPGLFAYLAP